MDTIPRTACAAGEHPGNGWRKAGLFVLGLHALLSPLLFCRWAYDPFEPIKAAWLQLTALALAGLGLCWLLENPGQAWALLKEEAAGWARDPLLLGAGLFLLSALLSTATSVSPWTSLL